MQMLLLLGIFEFRKSDILFFSDFIFFYHTSISLVQVQPGTSWNRNKSLTSQQTSSAVLTQRQALLALSPPHRAKFQGQGAFSRTTHPHQKTATAVCQLIRGFFSVFCFATVSNCPGETHLFTLVLLVVKLGTWILLQVRAIQWSSGFFSCCIRTTRWLCLLAHQAFHWSLNP